MSGGEYLPLEPVLSQNRRLTFSDPESRRARTTPHVPFFVL